MNAIREAAERYLTIRRGLGYKLKVEGRMLGQFVDFLQEREPSHLTVETALAWAVLPDGADPAWWAARLTVVREFARFLATFDERTRSRRRTCCPAVPGERRRRICTRPRRSARFSARLGTWPTRCAPRRSSRSSG